MTITKEAITARKRQTGRGPGGGLVAQIDDNLINSPLASFVVEGQSPQLNDEYPTQLMIRAIYCGMPVVRVGRGNNEGFLAALRSSWAAQPDLDKGAAVADGAC